MLFEISFYMGFFILQIIYNIDKNLQAPVKENDIIGTAEYYLGNDKIKVYNIYSGNEITDIDFRLCVTQVIKKILLWNLCKLH